MKMNLMEERGTSFDAKLSFLSDVHDTSVQGQPLMAGGRSGGGWALTG